MNIEDYLAILKRRWWVVLIPALLGPLIAYGISLFLPEEYSSQTLVLVEQQKVPENYVRSVVTEELNRRLGTMREQILSRTRLQPIIEKFGLYRDERDKVGMEALVERMRKVTVVTPIQPVVTTMRPNELPGFFISFTAGDPRVAQQVCSEITSMFMEENLKIREQRAQSTTDFLEKQLEDAKGGLDEQDKKLAAFKTRHIGQLPGQEQTNLNLLMGMNTQLEAVTQVLNRALQDKTYTESLLAQQLAAWQASLGETNPETLEQQLTRLQNDLVTLEARYTSAHPDVVKTKNDIAQVRAKIEELQNEAKNRSGGTEERVPLSEPPEVRQLRNQIHATETVIREKTREQERLQEQIKTYQARIQLSPMIEQQYKELTRGYETALTSYNDLLKKKTDSEMATDLERRQQGEQFRVMDPANLPERPSYPNRPLIAGGGFAVGLGFGLGLTLLLEMLDKSLRTDRDVEFYLQLPTLALVPTIETTDGKRSKFWRNSRSSAARPVVRPRA